MSRWLKIAAASAGGLILLLLAAGALAYGWLQTEGGRRWVEARIAAATDGQVRVEGLEGFLPFDARARHVVIADARGPWLTGEQVHFSMQPGALLRLHAQIETLSAERIAVSRRPEWEAEQPDERASPSPPRLPVSIELAQLHAPEILLARSMLGQAARLSLSGSGALSDGAARLDLTLRRLDAPGSATVDLAYDGRQLALEAAIDDPRGLVASALGAQSEVPVTLRASGAGPVRSWRGTVQASLAQAESGFSITIDDGRLTASGSLDPRPLLQPRIAALLPEPLRIEGAGRLGERRTLERIAIASGATRLSFEGAVRLNDLTGSGEARLALPDAAVLQPLLDMPLQGAASGTAVIDTTVEGQTAKLALRGERLAAEGYSAAAISVDATASRPRGAEEFNLAAVVRASGLAAERDAEGAVLPADLTLSFDGALAPAAGRLVARRLSLMGEGAEIAFSGSAQSNGLLDGMVHMSVPQVAPFARLAGLNWGGAATLDARLDASPGGGTTRFTIDGSWREPVTGVAALDPALGDAVVIAAAGSARYDGALDIETARVSSEALALSLSGRIATQGPLDARFELTASELGVFSSATAIAGSARINGRLTGTAAAPRLEAEAASPSLSVARTELRDLAVALDLTELKPDLRGSATGSVTVEGVRTEFASDLALENQVLSLAGLRARANGSTIAGDIALALEGRAATGAVELNAPDLAPWSKLAGMPLSGSGRARVALKEDGSASAEGSGSNISVADTRVAALRATAALSNWRAPLEGRIDLAAERITAGAVFLDAATLRLDPKDGKFPLRFSGSGTAAAPFTLEGRGVYEPDARRLRLAQLSGAYAQKPVQLRNATSLSFADGLAIAPFDLSWGGARIGGELALGRRLSGGIRVSGLPLQDVAAFAGRQDVQGTLKAALALSGTRREPAATLTATVSGLAFSGAPEQTPPGELSFTGDLSRTSLEWRAELSSRDADLSVTASGVLPVAWSDPPFGIAVERSGPLTARVDGSGEIAPLIALAGIGEDRATGRYLIDLRIAGSLDRPAVSGAVRVENGFYENFASGAELRDIRLEASGAQDRLQLTLAATDGEGGRVEGGGTMRFTGASIAAMDLTARLVDFRAIRRDDVRARATGDFALAGPLDQMLLSGQVRLDRMSISLPEQTRASAPVLDVIEVNAPEAGAERVTRTEATAHAPAAFKMGLDIDAELPRVEVAGRGLRSEWHGAVSVAGTTVAPQITGELRLDRGTFTALGKTFTLTEGLISFGGGPELDPSIRVIAEKEVRDAVARAMLTGSLSAPLLDFSARPELPVDEVLARLLFDKGAGQVGAAEALQLAQVAAVLQGGGTSTGVVERLGQKLGLDRIDISTVETVDEETGETGEAAALSLGKDISEDVRVGVEQGIQPGTGSVTVEVDLGKNLSVESRVGAEGRSGVGLKWEYDY